jgi:hypothetical protein
VVLRTVVLSVLLVGCAGFAGTLLTQDDPICYTSGAFGELVTDARYGTAIKDQSPGGGPFPFPVAWPPGTTSRTTGDGVEVIAPDGHVVAVTGKTYALGGGYGTARGVQAFLACGVVIPN